MQFTDLPKAVALLKVAEAAEAWRNAFEAIEWGTEEALLEHQIVLRNRMFDALDEWHKVEKEGS